MLGIDNTDLNKLFSTKKGIKKKPVKAIGDTWLELSMPQADDNLTKAVTYQIYRDDVFITDNGALLYYTDTGLTENTTYTYYVTCKDEAGNTSVPSNSVSVTTLTSANYAELVAKGHFKDRK